MFIFVLRRHIELIFLAIFLFGMVFFWVKGEKEELKNLLIAFFVALTWSILGRHYYGYNYDFITVYGVSFMPLFSWTLGLYLLFVIHLYHVKWFKIKKGYQKFLVFVFIYWVLLIVMETIAFHLIGIKDIANIKYKGLPICNCIHAPTFMKFVYFGLGIVYFILVNLFKKESSENFYLKES